VPLLGEPNDQNAAACGPGAIDFVLSNISADFDIAAHQADIDTNGNITFIVRYGPEGTVAHVGPNGIRDVVSGSTGVQIHVDRIVDFEVCGTPAVLVNGLNDPRGTTTNFFRFPSTNTPISVTITSTFSPTEIHYTLDGSQPNVGTPLYSGPLVVTNTVTVRAAVYDLPFYTPPGGRTNEPVVIEVVPVYALAFGTSGGGSVLADPPGGQYLSNSVVTLTASPAPGWIFMRWEGSPGNTNQDPVLAVRMDRARSVQAVFGTFITTAAQGPGSVSNDPAQETYPFGSTVRLTAVPDAGAYFSRWVGAASNQVVSPLDFVVTNAMPTNRALFGTLPQGTFALTVLVNGAGSVTKSPQLSNYNSGAEVTLSAMPDFGADFQLWSGDVSSTQSQVQVIMTTNRTVRASFTGGPNRPPLVDLIRPTVGETFVEQQTLPLMATASDSDGIVTRVDFHDGTTPLGSVTNAPFDFTWLAPTVGVHSLTAVATDNGGLSATSAPVMVTIQPVPVFSFARANYTRLEGETTIPLEVLKTPGSGEGAVNYATADGSTRSTGPSADYAASQGLLSFLANETNKTIDIQIHDDQVVESNQFFTVTLTPVVGSVTNPNTATVTIVDNDLANTGSVTQPASPGEPESPLSSLQVNLLISLSTNRAPGQWRFTWEVDWRDGGLVASNLPGGTYEIEFKPVSGYAEPPPPTLPVQPGTNQVETFYYTDTGGAQVGSLRVTLLPGSLGASAGWKRVGETTHHTSGETVDSLPVGSHTIEFNRVDGWIEPGRRFVTVQANRVKEVMATYSVEDPSARLLPIPQSFENVTRFGAYQPFTFCGQILSGSGWGSGWVAKERVVLTAAHVVYNDVEFSFQPLGSVKWFFQRHVGRYEPPPKLARGWCVLAGYSDQRIAEGTPGYSSRASQNLDVAALYFYEPAGRRSAPDALGGYGGYLVSRPDDPGQEWLSNPNPKTLVGYPVEGSDYRMNAVVPGRIYATIDQPNFTTRTNGVYSTLDIQGLPGMSGGPLCVQFADPTGNPFNNFYFPAAIYLGGSQETVVRLIDSEVADLINRAEILGDVGQDLLGGGPPRLGPGETGNTNYYGFVTVHLLPPEVTNQGAKYRFQNPVTLEFSDYYDQQTNLFAFLGNNPSATALSGWNIKFAAIPGYIAPADLFISMRSGQATNIHANYQAWGKLEAIPFGSNAVRLLGSSGSVYRVEYATMLLGTTSLLANAWMPVHTQRLNSSSAVVTNAFQRDATNQFLRAVLQP
jgi:hypothetical protein